MRAHKIILLLKSLISLAIVLITLFVVKAHYFEGENYKVVGYIILMVLLQFYPIAFYTCYRLISDGGYKGVFIKKFLIGTSNGIKGIFIVPLLLSILFIPDYIAYFKYDLTSK